MCQVSRPADRQHFRVESVGDLSFQVVSIHMIELVTDLPSTGERLGRAILGVGCGVEQKQQEPDPSVNEQISKMTSVEPTHTLQPNLSAVGVDSDEINSQIMSITTSGVETEQQEPDP